MRNETQTFSRKHLSFKQHFTYQKTQNQVQFSILSDNTKKFEQFA